MLESKKWVLEVETKPGSGEFREVASIKEENINLPEIEEKLASKFMMESYQADISNVKDFSERFEQLTKELITEEWKKQIIAKDLEIEKLKGLLKGLQHMNYRNDCFGCGNDKGDCTYDCEIAEALK